jgi:hypothetical protein
LKGMLEEVSLGVRIEIQQGVEASQNRSSLLKKSLHKLIS